MSYSTVNRTPPGVVSETFATDPKMASELGKRANSERHFVFAFGLQTLKNVNDYGWLGMVSITGRHKAPFTQPPIRVR